jgi:hypothetical protein
MAYSWDTGNDSSGGSSSGGSSSGGSSSGGSSSGGSSSGGSSSGPSSCGGGYSYAACNRSYDNKVNQSSQAKRTYQDPFLETNSPFPIIIGIDTTGSMDSWPGTFFKKLPLLYHEAEKYFPGCEISFQAINDFEADGADVALQPMPFGKGADLDKSISDIYAAGGGGGNGGESYEVFAAYNSFLKTPKALIKPIVIILGDEQPFPAIPDKVGDFYHLGIEERRSKHIFANLYQKCDVFLVRKMYGQNKDEKIVEDWQHMKINPERILTLDDPNRVVDVVLGILGLLSNNMNHFVDELTSRQEESQVKSVMKSIHLLSNVKSMAQGVKSLCLGVTSSCKSKNVLDK